MTPDVPPDEVPAMPPAVPSEEPPAARPRVRVTLAKVIAVQVVSLLVLWLLQVTFTR